MCTEDLSFMLHDCIIKLVIALFSIDTDMIWQYNDIHTLQQLLSVTGMDVLPKYTNEEHQHALLS